MRCLIVHNMRSGFGTGAIFGFERALLADGDECVMRTLASGQSAGDALTDAESFDIVVASGGDGTVASVLYALRGRDVPCCTFPSGTSNLLCLNLGMPSDVAEIAKACRIGSTASTDLGEVTFTDIDGHEHTHGFSIMMGCGYDAKIMSKATEGKPVMGEMAYFVAAVTTPDPGVHRFHIEIDGRRLERDGISCLIANNATLQGDFRIVPDASMDDGMLDVIILRQHNAVELLRPIAAGIMDPTGERIERPMVESISGRHIKVTVDDPVELEYDGEAHDGLVTSYEARVLPAANRIIVTPNSRYYDKSSRYNARHPRFGRSGLMDAARGGITPTSRGKLALMR